MAEIKLTPEQIEIVEFLGAPLRVLAGPGTGKTKCLVEKIKFLISKQKISPNEICAITFTRAAAGELRERIERSGINLDSLPYVNTLHGFALSLIKKHFSKVQLKENFQLINDQHLSILVNDVVHELKRKNIFLKRGEIKIFKQAHFQNKAKAGLPDHIKRDTYRKKILEQFSDLFNQNLEFYNSIDWMDILHKAIFMIDSRESVRKEVFKKAKHLLVDEFQDLSPLEQEFVYKIAGNISGLCAVGDDDQSIYETFRFADANGIINFLEKYPTGVSRDITLCWRCPPNIIEKALLLIVKNTRRAKKILKPANPQKKGYMIPPLVFKSKRAEIKWLTEKIIEIIKKGFKHEDIMVLFTGGDIAKDYIKEFQNNKIPLNIKLKVGSIFDTEDFFGLISSIKLILNPLGNLNIRYCLDKWKGIGSETVRQIKVISNLFDSSLWKAIKKIDQNLDVYKQIKNRRRVKDFFNFYQDLIKEKNPSEIKEKFEKRFISSINDEGCKTFWEYIEKFKENAELLNFEEMFNDFENKLESGKVELDKEKQNKGVNIMTMYSAKGCESPIVFIPALEDDIMPGNLPNINIEEKRRLFYVSITRAKYALFLSWAKQRTGQEIHMVEGRRMLEKINSRFLDDMEFDI